MISISTNNMQVGFQLLNSKNQNKPCVYAEKGDPIYQEDMDLDDDGVITLDEFTQYCDENDISYSQRKQMLENRLQYQLNTERARVSSEIREIKSESEAIYAEEGDEKYEKAMDENEDGKITYDEYLRYCEENASGEKEGSAATIEKNDSSDSEEEVIIRDSAKAISSYAKSENGEVKGKIQDEA